MSDIERRVRERAYQLWEAAGYPPNQSDEFWYRARQEIEDDVGPIGDAPGGAVDFPPDEMSLEDPPNLSVDTGMPFETVPGQQSGHAPPDAATLPIASIAVPEVHPSEPEAAEATVPREPAPGEPDMKSSRSVATSAARKAAEVAEEAAPSRRPRSGAARPASSRPAPSRPGRK